MQRDLVVTVDEAVCIGSGNCVLHAPGAFVQDEEMIARVADLGAAGIDAIRNAAAWCPSGAITVTEAVDG